jgi:crossover junction endodeoxyribonuclease RuvC
VRILGLDPGSRCTGVGVIEARDGRLRCLDYRNVRTVSEDFNQRLREIFDAVQSLAAEHRPDRVAIERVFVNSNAESSLKLGHARGAAICALVHADVPIAEYSPTTVKKALVGRGQADKSQVAHMVCLLLGLREAVPADAADALAVALCDHHHAETEARLRVAP